LTPSLGRGARSGGRGGRGTDKNSRRISIMDPKAAAATYQGKRRSPQKNRIDRPGRWLARLDSHLIYKAGERKGGKRARTERSTEKRRLAGKRSSYRLRIRQSTWSQPFREIKNYSQAVRSKERLGRRSMGRSYGDLQRENTRKGSRQQKKAASLLESKVAPNPKEGSRLTENRRRERMHREPS